MLLSLLILWGIFTFIFGVFRYNSNDMSPSLKSGNLVFTYRLDKDYISGDVVAIKRNGKILTGRVIALPGETVDITEEGLSVNGALLYEPNIYGQTRRYEEGIEFPVTLADDRFFLLCDNRENATDSRILVLYPAKIPLELLSCSCGDVEYKILVIRIL